MFRYTHGVPLLLNIMLAGQQFATRNRFTVFFVSIFSATCAYSTACILSLCVFVVFDCLTYRGLSGFAVLSVVRERVDPRDTGGHNRTGQDGTLGQRPCAEESICDMVQLYYTFISWALFILCSLIISGIGRPESCCNIHCAHCDLECQSRVWFETMCDWQNFARRVSPCLCDLHE